MASFVFKHSQLPGFRTAKFTAGRMFAEKKFAEFMVCGKRLSTRVYGENTSELTALRKAVEEAGGKVFLKKYKNYEQPEVALIIFSDGSCLAKNDLDWISGQDFSVFGDNAEWLRSIAIRAATTSKGGIHIFKDGTGIPVLTDGGRLTYLNLSEMAAGAQGITRIEVVDSTFNPETEADFYALRKAQLEGDTETIKSFEYEHQVALSMMGRMSRRNSDTSVPRPPEFLKPPNGADIILPGLAPNRSKSGGHADDRIDKVNGIKDTYLTFHVDDPTGTGAANDRLGKTITGNPDKFIPVTLPQVIFYTAPQISGSNPLFSQPSFFGPLSLNRVFFVSNSYGDPPGVTKYWKYLMVRISDSNATTNFSSSASKFYRQKLFALRYGAFKHPGAGVSLSLHRPFDSSSLQSSVSIAPVKNHPPKPDAVLSSVPKTAPILVPTTSGFPKNGTGGIPFSSWQSPFNSLNVQAFGSRSSKKSGKPVQIISPLPRLSPRRSHGLKLKPVSSKPKKTAFSAKDKSKKAKKDESKPKGSKKSLSAKSKSTQKRQFAKFLLSSGIRKSEPKNKPDMKAKAGKRTSSEKSRRNSKSKKTQNPKERVSKQFKSRVASVAGKTVRTQKGAKTQKLAAVQKKRSQKKEKQATATSDKKIKFRVSKKEAKQTRTRKKERPSVMVPDRRLKKRKLHSEFRL